MYIIELLYSCRFEKGETHPLSFLRNQSYNDVVVDCNDILFIEKISNPSLFLIIIHYDIKKNVVLIIFILCLHFLAKYTIKPNLKENVIENENVNTLRLCLNFIYFSVQGYKNVKLKCRKHIYLIQTMYIWT